MLGSSAFPVPVAEQEDRHHDEEGDAEAEADQHELVHLRLFDAWQKKNTACHLQSGKKHVL